MIALGRWLLVKSSNQFRSVSVLIVKVYPKGARRGVVARVVVNKFP